MPSVCSKCYQSVTFCKRASDTTKQCDYMLQDISTLRLASGGYDPRLTRITEVLKGVSPGHVDALSGHKPSTGLGTALSTDETTLLGTKTNIPAYDGLDAGNLDVGLSLASKRPAEASAIKRRMLQVLGAANTAANIAKLQAFVTLLDAEQEKASKSVEPTTNPTAFKEASHPMYQLWHKILKMVLSGQDLAEEVDQKTYFDATTGKTYTPFEKMPKCRTAAHLFRAFSMFKEAVTVLHGLAPRAWAGFEKQLYRAEAYHGHVIAQQFTGEVLRSLDLKEYDNVEMLLQCGEHNRILDDLRPPPGPLQPLTLNGQPPDASSSKRIKLSSVTKQGEFASLIKGKDGKPLLCNQHKAGEPCKAGVAFGQGLDAHAGKCAYHHPA